MGGAAAAAALIVVLVVITAVAARWSHEQQQGFDDGGGRDWLEANLICPPAAPAEADLRTVAPGQALGVPRAPRYAAAGPGACADRCVGTKGCSGWSFSLVPGAPQGPGAGVCRTFTRDDEGVIVHPPAKAGDYVSYSLLCAPRTGPEESAAPVPEVAAAGAPPAHRAPAPSAQACLRRCADTPWCVGATYHGPGACDLHPAGGRSRGLVLQAHPGGSHVTSASLYTGDHMLPIVPAAVPA